MRKITIDGDPYKLDLPTDYQMEEIQPYIPEADQNHSLIKSLIWRTPPFEGDAYLSTAILSKGTIKYCDTDEQVICNFRPALQMLYKPPKYWQNGKLVTGGSFYVNGQPLAPSRNKRSTFTYDKETVRSIAIGDTDEIPEIQLRWVYLNGYLICTRTLVTGISYQDLKNALEGSEAY